MLYNGRVPRFGTLFQLMGNILQIFEMTMVRKENTDLLDCL